MTQMNFLDVSLPIAGRAPRQRHASHSGAMVAAETRGQVTLSYIALLKALGPLSDHEASAALGRPLSSVNSIRNGLGARVVDSGLWESTPFRTKRTRWALNCDKISGAL